MPGPALSAQARRRRFLTMAPMATGAAIATGCTTRRPTPATPGTRRAAARRGGASPRAGLPSAAGIDGAKDGWRILGPRGGGAQYIPTLKPGDPDTALVACDMTGSYVTRDGGRTWTQFGLKSWVKAFAFDPSHPDTVYAGATGLYRSDDAGKRWRLVFPDPSAVAGERASGDEAAHAYVSSDNWPEGIVEAICVDPDDSGHIAIGVNCGALEVFLSSDHGASWAACCQIEGGKFCKAFFDATSPPDDRLLLILTDTGLYRLALARREVRRLPTPLQAGILDLAFGAFHSLNAGMSWRHTIDGVPESWSNTCYAIVFDPEVRGRAWSVWSACHDMPRVKMFRTGQLHRYEGGVCRTDDGLASWRPSNAGLPPNCIPTDMALDRCSPAGQRVLYVAAVGQGVYRSADDGCTWEARNEAIRGSLNAWPTILLPDGSLYLLTCRGLDGGRVVDGGLYRSTDAAETWRPALLPRGASFPNNLAFDPQEPRPMYLACWPATVEGVERYGGLYRTDDGGAGWTSVFDDASHVYGVAVDAHNPATVYLASFEGAVYRSGDTGASWSRLRGYSFRWTKTPILDPHHQGMLYLTTFGSSVWYGLATAPS